MQFDYLFLQMRLRMNLLQCQEQVWFRTYHAFLLLLLQKPVVVVEVKVVAPAKDSLPERRQRVVGVASTLMIRG